jgi:hypothetical protein
LAALGQNFNSPAPERHLFFSFLSLWILVQRAALLEFAFSARACVCAESHFKLDCWKKSLFRLHLSFSDGAGGMLTDDADWAPRETEFTAADHALGNLSFLRGCPQLIFLVN